MLKKIKKYIFFNKKFLKIFSKSIAVAVASKKSLIFPD